MSEQKKKFSPLFLLVHLSLQPHFLSHTMDLLQRPSFLIDFVGNRKKKREKRGGKLSLLFPLPSFYSLSLVREDLSLARAQNSSEIDPRSRTMTIPQSSTRTRRLRARARKSTKSSSPRRRRRRRTHERREFKRFFLSRERRERTRKKKNKEIKRDFQALPKEERTTPFLLLLFVLVSLVLLLLLHLSLLACTRLLFATAPAFRGHRSAFIVIIILYIFVLFVYYLAFVVWGSKISLFLSFSFSETTDRHTHTLRPLTRVRERSTTRER